MQVAIYVALPQSWSGCVSTEDRSATLNAEQTYKAFQLKEGISGWVYDSKKLDAILQDMSWTNNV